MRRKKPKPKPEPEVKPPMSARTYRLALKRYVLTQGQASWLFGGKTRLSGRRWAAEGAPYSVALTIGLMDEYDISPEDIQRIGKPWRRKRPR